ncbi:MAG: NAD-dependent succinate-semialdehyde dehydrogenase [Gammaproteobacteria bacterium]|nr:NAD-dependent succinate-semialdehyde dehydrogenase [Gammaproteobacteria bacterium]
MQLKNKDLLLTDGWINAAEFRSKRQFAVDDPATREDIATVSDLDATHAKQAIAAATTAYGHWKTVPSQERIHAVLRWAELIEENAEDLGVIISTESGKPLREAKGESLQCAALLRWYADEIQRWNTDNRPAPVSGQQNYTIKQPVGVVACITPWNFPAASVIVKAGAAILTGCTTIVKPSDLTPLIALAFARLSAAANLPAGVFNVLPCKDPTEIGNELCSNPDVRMLSFTGSTRVGKKLYAACGDTVKRLALELGGNAPFIVFDDADLDLAIDGAIGARYYNSGQICVGANRYFVHSSVYGEFARRLADRVSKMQVGNGFDPSSDIGPMINQAAIDRLTHVIESATEMGAEVLAGGGQDDASTLFFQPTVLIGMTPDMPAYTTEIFGPVTCLYEFENEDQVVALANNTEAGLAAYVYSRDTSRLARVSEALEAGVVGANSSSIFANDLPFGGIKQSGLGREHGSQGLEEYVETKSICLVSQ